MKAPIKFAENIFVGLKARAASSSPDLSTSSGDLFILPDAPIAGIRLKITQEEYFDRLQKLDHKFQIVPTDNLDFPVIVSGHVAVDGQKILIEGEEATILF